MLKVLALIKRLPELERSAFREHYEGRHVVVAKPLLEHLVRYARYHIEEELIGPIDFDVVTSFGYRDQRAVEDMFATLAGPAADAILEDEKRFMDKPANRFCEVSERAWREGEEEDQSIFVFVARPPDMPRAECSRRLLRDHWPALLERATDLRFAIVRDAFPMQNAPLTFDGLMQLSDSGGVDLRGFAAGLSEQGYRVVAVRTRRFVTPLPPA
jgi:hypothetical protein